jgi:AGZA family xanthine/uracil permease-like MFS transporter
VPAYATLILIPLTFSITQGILWGFILHAALHAVTGRAREVTAPAWGLAVISVALIGIDYAY